MPLFSRRRLLAGFAAIGAVAGVFGLRTASARYYDGPVSDHFDGVRFFDPHSSPPKSLATLMRWYWGREKAEWPARVPSPYSDKPPERVAPRPEDFGRLLDKIGEAMASDQPLRQGVFRCGHITWISNSFE